MYPKIFCRSLSFRISMMSVKEFMEYMKKIQWCYVNQASLWVNMPGNLKCPIIFGGSLPYRISVKSVVRFTEYGDEFIYSFMQNRFNYRLIWLNPVGLIWLTTFIRGLHIGSVKIHIYEI
jgi:hypothetical protein